MPTTTTDNRTWRPLGDLAGLKESDWSTLVVNALGACGWRWARFHPDARGGKGAPDILAVRPPRTIALELKRRGNKATPEQREWIADLAQANVEAHVLTMPNDWHLFEALIAKPPVQETLTTSTSGTVAWC